MKEYILALEGLYRSIDSKVKRLDPELLVAINEAFERSGADWDKAKTVWIGAARFNTEKDVHFQSRPAAGVGPFANFGPGMELSGRQPDAALMSPLGRNADMREPAAGPQVDAGSVVPHADPGGGVEAHSGPGPKIPWNIWMARGISRIARNLEAQCLGKTLLTLFCECARRQCPR